jgi:dsRNA-specific ribonuclease
MVNKIYSKREIEIEYFGKPPTTRFIQLFNRHGAKTKLENYIEYKSDDSFDIRLPSWIAEAEGIENPFFGNYINTSLADAFRGALRILDDRGLLSKLEETTKRKPRISTQAEPKDDRQWKMKISEVIKQILKRLLPPNIDPAFLGKFFTKETIVIWARCFTDPSYDSKNNYNVPEFVGDRILNSLFILHCQQFYPDLKRMDYSILLHSYQKKGLQKDIAINLKLDTILRSNSREQQDQSKADKTYSDLFEAFVGSLHEVGNKIVNGLGIELCRNLVKILYPSIDLQLSKPPYTTVFTQIFQKLSLPNKKSDYLSVTETGDHIVSLPSEVVTFLSKNNIQITSVDRNGRYPIGRYSNVDQEEAFRLGLLDLKKKLGIDTEWSSRVKNMIDFGMVNEDLRNQTLELAQNLGYHDLSIERPTRDNIYYLYGNKDGREYLLSTVKVSSKFNRDSRLDAFPQLFSEFIRIHSQQSQI